MLRVFIVGSPRSGTTLLQSILATHKGLISFPESHILYEINNVTRLKRILGITGLKSVEKIKHFVESNVKDPNFLNEYGPKTLLRNSWVGFFLDSMDQVVKERNNLGWIEKTPNNLYFLDQIPNRYDVKIIHIVRNGLDVVNSVQKIVRLKTDQDSWQGNRDLLATTRRWVLDVNISKRYLSENNHYFVHYDDLVSDPIDSTMNLCKKLGVEYMSEMNKRYKDTAVGLIEKHEVWKMSNIKQGEFVGSENVLSDQEISQVQQMIKEIDLNVFKA